MFHRGKKPNKYWNNVSKKSPVRDSLLLKHLQCSPEQRTLPGLYFSCWKPNTARGPKFRVLGAPLSSKPCWRQSLRPEQDPACLPVIHIHQEPNNSSHSDSSGLAPKLLAEDFCALCHTWDQTWAVLLHLTWEPCSVPRLWLLIQGKAAFPHLPFAKAPHKTSWPTRTKADGEDLLLPGQPCHEKLNNGGKKSNCCKASNKCWVHRDWGHIWW